MAEAAGVLWCVFPRAGDGDRVESDWNVGQNIRVYRSRDHEDLSSEAVRNLQGASPDTWLVIVNPKLPVSPQRRHEIHLWLKMAEQGREVRVLQHFGNRDLDRFTWAVIETRSRTAVAGLEHPTLPYSKNEVGSWTDLIRGRPTPDGRSVREILRGDWRSKQRIVLELLETSWAHAKSYYLHLQPGCAVLDCMLPALHEKDDRKVLKVALDEARSSRILKDSSASLLYFDGELCADPPTSISKLRDYTESWAHRVNRTPESHSEAIRWLEELADEVLQHLLVNRPKFLKMSEELDQYLAELESENNEADAAIDDRAGELELQEVTPPLPSVLIFGDDTELPANLPRNALLIRCPEDSSAEEFEWVEKSLSRFVESWTQQSPTCGSPPQVFVNWKYAAELNCVDTNVPGSLLAMLILAFPEIQWKFFGDAFGKSTFHTEIHHEDQDALSTGSVLFDASGLRDAVRAAIRTSVVGCLYLPLRQALSVSIDDERDYCLLHGLTAYRFGFRNLAILRWAEAEELLDTPAPDGTNGFTPELTIEDVFLSFPDQPADKRGLKLFSDRDKVLKRNHNVFARRHVVTVGFDTSEFSEVAELNTAYINGTWKPIPSGQRTVLKPYGGMFDLWNKLGMRDPKRTEKGQRNGLARGYIWPPSAAPLDLSAGGHSAPGVLLLVSRSLVERAKILFQSDRTDDLVRGAVLARDSMELLGGRVPTKSLEALAEFHKCEVKAECQFAGVEYHVALRDRLKEIRDDIADISKKLHMKRQRSFALNGEAFVLRAIQKIFNEFNEYDESQMCHIRLRQIHGELLRLKALRRNWIGARLVLPLARYTDMLLVSVRRAVLALVVWLALFTAAFKYIGHDLENAFERAFTVIATFNLPPGYEDMKQWAVALQHSDAALVYLGVLVGVFHLGILVSLIYARAARE